MPNRSLFDTFQDDSKVVHGLPAEAYVSADFFAAERTGLFAAHWVFADFAHRLAKAGDVSPIEIAGVPLFLVRDGGGQVSAYHNVCRHRNLKLVDAAGNCGKMIRCPYHSWSYDLCGALVNAPFFGGGLRDLPQGFEPAEFGLRQVSCEVWHDWVFVNLAEKPVPFDEFLAPLRRQLGETNVADYQPVATIEFGEIECNWKLLMENFIEPYHVQFVHRTTTRQPLEDHYTVIDEHCVGSAVDLGEQQDGGEDLTTLGVTSHYLTLFPSFVMGTYQPDQMGVYLHQPIAPERTRQTRVIYTHRESHYSENQIRELERLWHSVHLEDHAMCLRLQQGRRSPLATDGGLLSPAWENSVRRFQEMVADSVRPLLTD